MKNYPVTIFDCDGVILDSNQLKSDAMAESVKEYGSELGERFVAYHRQNGGISRYKKFDYFLRNLVGSYSEAEYRQLLSTFSTLVKKKLVDVPLTTGALEFIETCYRQSDVYIVSGSDQEELREVFTQRNLAKYFVDIFGSPTGKHTHCTHILSRYSSNTPAVFFGDGRQDHLAARDNEIEFIFISNYTDMDDWREYCSEHEIRHFTDLAAAHENFA